MSQQELESYLARSITLAQLINLNTPNNQNIYTDTLRMITNIQPKFIGRAGLLWSNPTDNDAHFARANQTAIDVHAIDTDIIIQGGIFEYIHKNVTASQTAIQIPSWVYDAFGLPTPSNPTYFEFNAIVYDNWATSSNQMYQGATPDLNKLQARMWFYYRARRYIDSGFEALHLGNIRAMTINDNLNIHLWGLVSKIRAYAALHARRNFVLLDAHTQGEYYNNTNKLIFDFHSAPIRMKETSETKGNKGCKFNWTYGLYGNRLSHGGLCFMGWQVDSLPYLIEFDNYGVSNFTEQLTDDNHPKHWFNWGYDEITWFALQSVKFRKYWLQYAHFQLRYMSSVGHVQMPGIRRIRISPADPYPWPNYYSNTPSAILPNPDTDNDGFPNLNHSSSNNGYDMEETIKDIWNGDTTFLTLTPLIQGNTGSYQIIETAISPSGKNIYCLGDDNRLYNYWKSGQTWRRGELSANVTNVGGSLIVNDKGHIYYRGTDKRIHKFYYDNGWKNVQLISNAPANINGEIFFSNSGNNIFYKGTDNRMYNYWYGGGSWNVAPLDYNVTNVEGSITVHSDGKLFYRGMDNKIHYFHYDNGWKNVTLIPNAPNNVHGNFVIADHGRNIFYRDFGGQMQNYWKDGSVWKHDLLSSGTSANPHENIKIDKFNRTYYKGSDNQIHMHYYDQGWQVRKLDPNYFGIASTLHVSANADFVFFINLNGDLDHVWWDGDNWTSDIKWENSVNIKNVPFIEKGDQLYVVSADNKIYSMTFGTKY
jgi:hypothetical protein